MTLSRCLFLRGFPLKIAVPLVHLSQRKRTGSGKSFKYLNEVQICEGADFLLVLKCLADNIIYLDPAVKAESWQKPGETIKKRNQFRIAMKSLAKPYQAAKFVRF